MTNTDHGNWCGLSAGGYVGRFYNNTVYKIEGHDYNTWGIGYGYITVKNNLVANVTCLGGGTAKCFWVASDMDSNHDYNIADDASPVGAGFGAHSLASQSVASMKFKDVSTGDLRTEAGSVAAGAGVDLSSVFTTDILGNTRTTWDVGAFNVEAPAGHPSGLRSQCVPFMATKPWRNNFGSISRSN
jgi:hypothetical protein